MKKYIKPYIPQFFLIVLLVFLSIVADLNLPRLMSVIVDEGVIKGDLPLIYRLGRQMIILTFVSVALMSVATYFIAKTSMSFSRDLRSGLFDQVLDLSFQQFQAFGAPSILTRTTDDIGQMERISVVMLRPLVRAPLMFIGAIVMSVITAPKLSLVVLFSAPLLLFFIMFIVRRALPMFREVRLVLDQLTLVFRERLTGIRVIRAFHQEEREEDRFTKTNENMRSLTIRVSNIMILMLPVFNTILNFTILILLWFGAKQVDMGQLEVGKLMAIIQYITQVMFAVMMFSMLFSMFPNAQASYHRIMEVLDTPIAPDEGLSEIPEGVPTLEFRNVSFAYPGAERPVLEDISFKVQAGEKLAIIGGTGSGKSTILKLINRFYPVTSGEILLNGVNINDYRLKTLRDALGYVPQTAQLFSRSVKENVGFGLEKSLLDDQTWDALSVAQAEDFIKGMSGELEAPIAQGGRNLSGGQKQRLSIARAIAKDPMIFMFDDSFSALDFKTDKKLRDELGPKTKDKIEIVVAQRVMTVTDADEILVLEDGIVEDRGTHDELMIHSDIYRDIAESQFGKEVAHG